MMHINAKNVQCLDLDCSWWKAAEMLSLRRFLKFEDLGKEPSVRHMVLILNGIVFFKWDNLQKKLTDQHFCRSTYFIAMQYFANY